MVQDQLFSCVVSMQCCRWLYVCCAGLMQPGTALLSSHHPAGCCLACKQATPPSLLQFKIIDFGISKMSAKLAEAAGGREAQVRCRMRALFIAYCW